MILLGFTAAALFLSLRPFLMPLHEGLFAQNGDLGFLTFVFNGFRENVVAGNFIPAWAEQTYGGYGSPLYLFINPIPGYVFSLLTGAGITEIRATLLCLAIPYVVGIVGAARFFKKPSWVLIYGLLPLFFGELYKTAHVENLYLFALIPWIFSQKKLAFRILLQTAAIIADPIIGFCATTVACIMLPTRKRMLELMLVVPGTLLASTFWIPRILERRFITPNPATPALSLQSLSYLICFCILLIFSNFSLETYWPFKFRRVQLALLIIVLSIYPVISHFAVTPGAAERYNFLPATVPSSIVQFPHKLSAEPIRGRAEVSCIQDVPTQIQCDVMAIHPSLIRFNIFEYPHWRSFENKAETQSLPPDHKTGALLRSFTPGKHLVTLRLVASKERWIGRILSLIGLIVFTLIVLGRGLRILQLTPMKRITATAIFSCSLYLFAPLAFAKTSTLSESFQAALRRDEKVAIHAELITQAQEQYGMARAAILPNISAIGTYQRQQSPPAGTATSISPAEQTTVRINATQPLFKGFKEFAALSQQSANIDSQFYSRLNAKLELHKLVAQNFYTILTLEQSLRNLKTELELETKRVEELESRVRIGRSKPSEVLSIRTAIDLTAAQIEQVKGQVAAARDTFALITGFDHATDLKDTETERYAPERIEAYVSRLEKRPDIKAAQANLQAVESSITIARSGHWPTIDLGANYYFKRPGLLSETKWDAQITGTLPLFQGGATVSQVSAAAAQAKAAELTAFQIRKKAEDEVRTLYRNFMADLAQMEKLERAAKTADENYRMQTRDYRLGLVTNLDVLSALASSQQTLRSLDSIRFQTKLDYIRLVDATASAIE